MTADGSRIFYRYIDDEQDADYLCGKERTFESLYYTTAILLSVFAGFLGADRFYLGYTCLGVTKLFTFGCCGIWWIVDIALLLAGFLAPANDISFNPILVPPYDYY